MASSQSIPHVPSVASGDPSGVFATVRMPKKPTPLGTWKLIDGQMQMQVQQQPASAPPIVAPPPIISQPIVESSPPEPVQLADVLVGSLIPPPEAPPEELLNSAAEFLQNYPEVEWASFANMHEASGHDSPVIAIKLDSQFRQRSGEILLGIENVARSMLPGVKSIVLDDQALMRSARNDTLVFYPWRRSRVP